MLRTNKKICFRGGFEGVARISSESAKRLEPNQKDCLRLFRAVRAEIQRKAPA